MAHCLAMIEVLYDDGGGAARAADLIRRALARAGGCRRGAAELLNLKVSTLNAKIKRHRVRPDAFKTAVGSS